MSSESGAWDTLGPCRWAYQTASFDPAELVIGLTTMATLASVSHMAKKKHTTGAVLLGRFLDSHKLTLRTAAGHLGVSDVAVLSWRSGKLRPGPEWRLALARWTRGAVPAEAWLTEDERSRIEAICPLGEAA